MVIKGAVFNGMSPADAAKLTDALRWFQSLALEMAKAYAEGVANQPVAPSAPAEGFVVKDYHPGKIQATGVPGGRNRKR